MTYDYAAFERRTQARVSVANAHLRQIETEPAHAVIADLYSRYLIKPSEPEDVLRRLLAERIAALRRRIIANDPPEGVMPMMTLEQMETRELFCYMQDLERQLADCLV